MTEFQPHVPGTPSSTTPLSTEAFVKGPSSSPRNIENQVTRVTSSVLKKQPHELEKGIEFGASHIPAPRQPANDLKNLTTRYSNIQASRKQLPKEKLNFDFIAQLFQEASDLQTQSKDFRKQIHEALEYRSELEQLLRQLKDIKTMKREVESYFLPAINSKIEELKTPEGNFAANSLFIEDVDGNLKPLSEMEDQYISQFKNAQLGIPVGKALFLINATPGKGAAKAKTSKKAVKTSTKVTKGKHPSTTVISLSPQSPLAIQLNALILQSIDNYIAYRLNLAETQGSKEGKEKKVPLSLASSSLHTIEFASKEVKNEPQHLNRNSGIFLQEIVTVQSIIAVKKEEDKKRYEKEQKEKILAKEIERDIQRGDIKKEHIKEMEGARTELKTETKAKERAKSISRFRFKKKFNL